MNIEATNKTNTATKTTETTPSTQSTAKDGTKSFKEELNTAKTQDKTAQDKSVDGKDAKIEEIVNTNVNQIKNVQNNALQAKNQALKDKATNKNNILDPVNELTEKIETLSSLKTNSTFKTQNISSKSEELSDKKDCFKSMKMDNNDATFFLNLVQNQNIQNNPNINNLTSNAVNNASEGIKAEATAQAAKVSETLMNALNESMKTNKPFRIDFDNNIAVIMKVDKNGTLSANFIPGDAAVENYLRNNIEGLKQSFSEQNLNYNELSYSQQQKQKQQNKNKENKDE